EDKWDVMSLEFSWGGRYRSISVKAHARTAGSGTDTRTGRAVKLPDVGGANVTGGSFSRTENLLAFYVAGDNSPADLHVLDLRTGDHRRLTAALNPKVKPENL